jgi:hypothetical protein
MYSERTFIIGNLFFPKREKDASAPDFFISKFVGGGGKPLYFSYLRPVLAVFPRFGREKFIPYIFSCDVCEPCFVSLCSVTISGVWQSGCVPHAPEISGTDAWENYLIREYPGHLPKRTILSGSFRDVCPGEPFRSGVSGTFAQENHLVREFPGRLSGRTIPSGSIRDICPREPSRPRVFGTFVRENHSVRELPGHLPKRTISFRSVRYVYQKNIPFHTNGFFYSSTVV